MGNSKSKGSEYSSSETLSFLALAKQGTKLLEVSPFSDYSGRDGCLITASVTFLAMSCKNVQNRDTFHFWLTRNVSSFGSCFVPLLHWLHGVTTNGVWRQGCVVTLVVNGCTVLCVQMLNIIVFDLQSLCCCRAFFCEKSDSLPCGN